jgi:hypothetical protein
MSSTQRKLELFIENYRILTDAKFPHKVDRRLAAFIYTINNRLADTHAIEQNYSMIINDSDIRFLDKGKHVATLLSLHENNADTLTHVKAVYSLMVELGFYSDSPYIGVAAYIIAMGTEPGNFQNTAIRASTFYNEMKASRRYYINETRYPYAALFGLSNIDVMSGLQHIEQLIQWYGTTIKTRHEYSIQRLSMVLALSSSVDSNRVIALRNAVKERGEKWFEDVVFSGLGLLAQHPADVKAIVQELNNTKKELIRQKDFNRLFVSKCELFSTSVIIIMSTYLDDVRSKSTVVTEIDKLEKLIIEMQYTQLATTSKSAKSIPNLFNYDALNARQ